MSILKFFIAVTVSASIFPMTASATDKITSSEPVAIQKESTAKIDRFGVCRNVANAFDGNSTLMVPVRDQGEWMMGE